MKDLAEKMGIPFEKLAAKVASLQEANPMLGLRGCRLGILYPEITEMQARAIFEAACEVKRSGIEVKPEIMIPLVGDVNELRLPEGGRRSGGTGGLCRMQDDHRLQGRDHDRDTPGSHHGR